ncbi:MAG TPA: GNAT family N-acetyltransferase [Pirellulales bacterium]|jgi:RimJ/RimL family protein N-acetyltransferase|nr:GNAT family N-acetyltransferase [Pirellulales bacterium]
MRIQTARLILREFCPADWPAVHRYASDDEVVRYQDWGPNSEPQTVDFITGGVFLSRGSTGWSDDRAARRRC